MKINFKILNLTKYISFLVSFICLSELLIKSVYANNSLKDDNLNIEYLNKKDDDFYILGVGDTILLDVIKSSKGLEKNKIVNKELTDIKVLVDINGEIDLPEIGKIYVSGLTKNELENLLDIKFKKYVKRPNLNITVIKPKPLKVNVTGEVKNPGIYSFSFGTNSPGPISYENTYPEQQRVEVLTQLATSPTIFEAIRRAGGITPYSDLNNIEVIRINPISSGGGLIKTQVNLLSVLNTGDTSQNIKLMNNDIIKIKKSSGNITFQIREALKSNINSPFIKVYISGDVPRRGPLKLMRNSDLNTAILASGGQGFFKGKITLNRYTTDGGFESKKISFSKNSKRGSANNPYLYEGDIIYVGKSGLKTLAEIVTDVTKPFVGIYSTYKIFD